MQVKALFLTLAALSGLASAAPQIGPARFQCTCNGPNGERKMSAQVCTQGNFVRDLCRGLTAGDIIGTADCVTFGGFEGFTASCQREDLRDI